MKTFSFLFILYFTLPVAAFAGEIKVIPQGNFAPQYGIEKDQVEFLVPSFRLDVYPVTVRSFNDFIKSRPEWSKKSVSSLYADKNYLAPKKQYDLSPVVNVSWFAAEAYCQSKKGRLPSTLEWEYAAAASETMRDASKSEAFVDKILLWYSSPDDENKKLIIGKDAANIYGIHNLHGLVWEWTADFNSVIMTSDNREDGNKEAGLYCGSGSIASKSKEDYAAFVRYSLRSSLKAQFSLTNLGFRCAYD